MIRNGIVIIKFVALLSVAIVSLADIAEKVVGADVHLRENAGGDRASTKLKLKDGDALHSPIAEENIPVIEIKGEGKPMTAAQIRALEEEAEGKPLDIKVKHTWRPSNCPRAAKRKDFVTFNYKLFMEDGKKVDQTYGNRPPIRIQLGVGLTMPGLDKGLQGMCDTELRKIQVPHRLSRKRKSRVWKTIPNDEHWLTFDIEMMSVEAWTPLLQFQYMDLNNDSMLTSNELVKYSDKMRKDFGRIWPNGDIDVTLASKYYIKYFDSDGDSKVTYEEFKLKTELDDELASSIKKKPKGRRRDPGVMSILDFNNDGIVTIDEVNDAPDTIEDRLERMNKENKARDEL